MPLLCVTSGRAAPGYNSLAKQPISKTLQTRAMYQPLWWIAQVMPLIDLKTRCRKRGEQYARRQFVAHEKFGDQRQAKSRLRRLDEYRVLLETRTDQAM